MMERLVRVTDEGLLCESTERRQNQREYLDSELVEALRTVDTWHPYQRMSEDVYDKYRSVEHPSSDTIIDRLGPWSEVRSRFL